MSELWESIRHDPTFKAGLNHDEIDSELIFVRWFAFNVVGTEYDLEVLSQIPLSNQTVFIGQPSFTKLGIILFDDVSVCFEFCFHVK